MLMSSRLNWSNSNASVISTDAGITAEKTKLELAVLLFPDPRTPYLLQTNPNVS